MKLELGTAQFGMKYGFINDNTRLSVNEIKEILTFAEKNEILVLDTSSAYGESEAVLGNVLEGKLNFRIITKQPLYYKDKISVEDINVLRKSFHQSLNRLKRKQVYGVLIQRADVLLEEGGDLFFHEFENFKTSGLVEKIGVSVYTAEQIDILLKKYNFDIIQLPVNVLDQHIVNRGCLSMLKNKGVEIHARSIFLQGVLIVDPSSLPNYFNPVKPHLQSYMNYLSNRELTPIEGAIGFIKGISEIDYVILGVNNIDHFRADVDIFNRPVDSSLVGDLFQFALNDQNFVQPRFWQLN